ncbi:MAG TPA: hypothetical protein VF252_00970 [Gemmatimonadales bacterium]
MSNPFSGIPDPGTPRPFKRRVQPRIVQETLRAMQEALRRANTVLRPALPAAQVALARVQRTAGDASRRAQRYGQDLWYRGKRNPRTVGVVGGAVALTLVGAYALSASGAGRSLCPDRKTPQFDLLMDPVLQIPAGSKVEIHYDVCGLKSGTPYVGKVRLAQQKATGKKKKKSASPKPLVVSFKDKVDGVATRRHQELDLARAKPGTYTLELSVADNRGRERKRAQKVVIKAQ